MNSAEQQGWRQTAFVAVAVLLSGIVGWEYLFASLGGSRQPVADSAELWSEWRERAAHAKPGDLLLIGASRMQLDMDLSTLERVTGQQSFQLAIDGASFLPVLGDLATDPRVRGDVIISIRPPDLTGRGVQHAQETVDSYRQWLANRYSSPSQYTEDLLEKVVYSFVPSREQGVRPETLFALWREDKRISAYITTYATREREGDYSRVDAEALRNGRYLRSVDWYSESAQTPQEVIDQNLAFIRAAVAAIRARGGDVIFVRFPISAELLAASEEYLPDEKYLGRITPETGAKLINFVDYPSLNRFYPPDGSHLDVTDQVEFTAALAEILLETKQRKR